MDLKQLNKPVTIGDIDFRVQSINNGGYATILAYKDARYDMNVLDEVVGAGNWQKDYKIIADRLYCGVAVRCGSIPNEWVWKWDVGTESNTEKEKGQASDSFKRACFNWGIGRELYDFPVIQVKLNTDEFEVSEYNGKKSARATYKLNIKEWVWSIERGISNKITSLIATDKNNNVRFSLNGITTKQVKTPVQAPAKVKEALAPPKKEPAVKTTVELGTARFNQMKNAIEKGTYSIAQLKGMYDISLEVEVALCSK